MRRSSHSNKDDGSIIMTESKKAKYQMSEKRVQSNQLLRKVKAPNEERVGR